MGYCTLNLMRAVLPRLITIGDTTMTTPTIEKPAGGTTTIETKEAERFIDMASQHIDGRLRPVYMAPLKRVRFVEVEPISEIKKGATKVYVQDNGPFNISGWVKIEDKTGYEVSTIKLIPDNNFTEIDIDTATTRAFSIADGTTISFVTYPDPIPSMAARIAVSMIIDKLFTSEQSPDVSNYGKTLRTNTSADMDSILAGVIRLEGQNHTGRRFCRTSVRDTWSTSGEHQQGVTRET